MFSIIILTLVQIISGCWSIYGYSTNSKNMTLIAYNYKKINALNDAYTTISAIRSQMWKLSFMMANGKIQDDNNIQLQHIKESYGNSDTSM